MTQLFSDEEIITQSSDGSVILTTHRICYEYKKRKRIYNQNIKLEDVISCKNHFSSQIVFLIFAGISLLGGIVGILDNDIHILRTLIVTSIFIVLYLMTRLRYIVITSTDEKMKIRVVGMKKQQITDFINKIELAKRKRLLSSVSAGSS